MALATTSRQAEDKKFRSGLRDAEDGETVTKHYDGLSRAAKMKFKKKFLETGNFAFVTSLKESVARRTQSHTERLDEKLEPQISNAHISSVLSV
jgi:hypothetical protein